MAEHARCQQLHDASVVYRLSSGSSCEGLVVRRAILCDELAQFVYRPLVDHAMGCDSQLIDRLEGFHREAEKVAMLNVSAFSLLRTPREALAL